MIPLPWFIDSVIAETTIGALKIRNPSHILAEYRARLLPKKEIAYEGLDVFKEFMDSRLAGGESCLVFLVAGCRKSGKTTNSIKINDYAESVLGRNPPSRRMIFQVDWALHPRTSPHRDPERPYEEFYRWGVLSEILDQLTLGMKSGQEKITLRHTDGMYVRFEGTTKSKSGDSWAMTRFVHQPRPVAVVEGTYAHHPVVLEHFQKEGISPIKVLFYADIFDQAGRALDQKPESRSLEDEIKLNNHDVHAWEQIRQEYHLDQDADVLAWSFNGKVAFHRNPIKYVSDPVGFLY